MMRRSPHLRAQLPGLVLGALLGWACSDRNILAPPAGLPPESGPGEVEAMPEEPGLPDTSLTPEAPNTPDPLNPPSPAPLPGIAEEAGVATGSTPGTDRLALAVGEILSLRCAECHGGSRADGGLGEMRDLAQLIALGVIVPGSSATSPLLQRLRDGNMPHANVSRRPTTGELSLLERFIDRLPSAPAPPCDAPPLVSADEIYAAALDDAVATSAEDQPFLRYVSLTYASNAGLCGPALARQRSALFKLVNSVSTAPEIHLPRAIGSEGVLYRIDLRDYGWNRDIDLEDDGSADFADGWLAIATAARTYAIELAGPEADELKRLTGAPVPVLPANALIHAATAGDLYYGLIGARRSSSALRAQLGFDAQAYAIDRKVRHAVFGMGPSNSLRRVARFEQEANPGRYYWQLQEEFSYGDESIFQDPLDDIIGPVQVIYNLANGMQAYELDDVDDARLPALPNGCTTEPCEQEPLPNAITCHACHEAGLIAVTDLVRDYVETYPEQFDNEMLDGVRTVYPGTTQFNELLDQGSQVHRDAAQRTGVGASGPEPISFVHHQFELDTLDLRRAAGELGVTPRALAAAIKSPNGSLGPLLAPDGKITRGDLDRVYAAARCALDEHARNRPLGCL